MNSMGMCSSRSFFVRAFIRHLHGGNVRVSGRCTFSDFQSSDLSVYVTH